MTKAELVESIAAEMATTKADADRFLTAFTRILTGAVAGGDTVRIPGLGAFATTHRAQRNGVNPQTGAAIVIAARARPAFRPAEAFIKAVNGDA